MVLAALIVLVIVIVYYKVSFSISISSHGKNEGFKIIDNQNLVRLTPVAAQSLASYKFNPEGMTTAREVTETDLANNVYSGL
jgi:hypothetical protein